jgi:hypothetical protein
VSSAVDVKDADLIEFKGTRQMQCLCITSNDAGIYRKDDGDHGWVVY